MSEGNAKLFFCTAIQAFSRRKRKSLGSIRNHTAERVVQMYNEVLSIWLYGLHPQLKTEFLRLEDSLGSSGIFG